MDHLATPFSREADPGLIEEEELANLSKSSPVRSNSRAGIPGPSSDPPELDHASGTDDIPGNEDTESFPTFDKYNDARFETSSISSSRTVWSSFSRMTSATRESFHSVQSLFFVPSVRTRNMNIRQLVQFLQSRHRLSKTSILDMTTYSQSVINIINVITVIKHMFVIFRLRQGRRECWLRLDRRAEDPISASFIFSGMQGPAKDEVCHCIFLAMYN